MKMIFLFRYFTLSVGSILGFFFKFESVDIVFNRVVDTDEL